MEPTNTNDFEFTGTAGDIFVIFLWNLLAAFLSIFGAPLAMQKAGKILASKIKVNGRELAFEVTYWDAFKFILVQQLLVIVTLGIYYFWFVRNMYRFTLAHTNFADKAAAAQSPQTTPYTPQDAFTPQTPATPTAVV